MFNNVLIVGLGLIGGSLAIDIKNLKLAQKLYAMDTNEKSIKKAIDLGIIDEEFRKDVEYDFAIFCNPISSLENTANTLKQYLNNAIITDVASVKVYVERILKNTFGKRFVGSHPIAGSHKSGFGNATKGLFCNNLVVICPHRLSQKEYIEKIESFWQKIGAKTIIMNAETHDEIFAITSHLPHLVAFSLSSLLDDNYKNFVGQGFLDTTRIGASQPELWSDIFLYNKENILKAVKQFTNNLNLISEYINKQDKENLLNILRDISKKRNSL